MTTTVIIGGGIGGLATALAVAGRGRRVLILEQDGPPTDEPPAAAGQRWARPHVASWRHAHILTSLGVSMLRDRAPLALSDAIEAGGVLLDLVRALPPRAQRPPNRIEGDDELVALACRRATLEVVLYRIVRSLPDVEIRHRVRVGGLQLAAGSDRITGVRVGGESISAGLVIDATGRRAAARTWLAAAGIALDDDLTSPASLRIFSRFYEPGPDASPAPLPGPLNRGNAAGVLNDHYAAVLHPADNGAISISLGALPQDRRLRVLRDHRAFTAGAMASPGVVDWLTRGRFTPLSDVRTYTCPPNALSVHATTWPPRVTGLLSVGDAVCVTNPLYGRGVSLALAHAFAVGDLLAAHPEPGPAQSQEAAKIAKELFTPWYRQAAADDADRAGRWQAALTGAPPPPDPDGLTIRTVGAVAGGDGFIWRGLMRVLMGLRPPAEVFGAAEFEDRVRRAQAAQTAAARSAPGPSRAELIAAITDDTMVTGAAGTAGTAGSVAGAAAGA